MSMTEAIIQGIIQGLTEFLPVSSSGHLCPLPVFYRQQFRERGALFAGSASGNPRGGLYRLLGEHPAAGSGVFLYARGFVQGPVFPPDPASPAPDDFSAFRLASAARADLPPQGSYAGGGRRRQYHRRGGLLPRDLRAAASCQQLPARADKGRPHELPRGGGDRALRRPSRRCRGFRGPARPFRPD